MGWDAPKAKEYGPTKYTEECNWFSTYPDSQERWIADMKPYYDLVGVYDIDGSSLYRFKLDESLRHELVAWSHKFHNVLIKHEPKH